MSDRISRRAVLALGAAAAGEVLLSETVEAAESRRRVLVWSEGTAPKNVYPKDINGAVAEALKAMKGWEVGTASINDPEQGVSEEALQKANVLVWWGHVHHGKVKDEYVDRIVRRVKEEGMGFIALHSAHYSKALRKLLGTPCGWKGGYVEDGSRTDVIVKDKMHPIAQGIVDFTLPHEERYSEPFEIPEPASVVFDGLYHRPDGTTESSRQGLCWSVGKGKVFYFQPGHETYKSYFDANVQKILRNAVAWAGSQKS